MIGALIEAYFLTFSVIKQRFCSRNFAISRVQKTNLFLLAVESTCGKCESKGMNGNELPGLPGVSKENILFNFELSQTSERYQCSSCICCLLVDTIWEVKGIFSKML